MRHLLMPQNQEQAREFLRLAMAEAKNFGVTAAQAQQGEGEPVAWVHEKVVYQYPGKSNRFEGVIKRPEGMYGVGMIPLYTHPQPDQQVPEYRKLIELVASRLSWLCPKSSEGYYMIILTPDEAANIRAALNNQDQK